MKENSKQHIQLPNDFVEIKTLNPKDLLVYTYLRKYMNGETKLAFPSLETLHKETGIYIGGIRESIKKLEQAGVIEVIKKGRQNIYKFFDPEKFEPFSPEFLDKSDLTVSEKAQLIASQQFMFKDKEKMEGRISMSNRELAEKINSSESTVRRINTSLSQKNYAKITPIIKENGEIGQLKIYNLYRLGQAIIFKLKEHEERLSEHEDRISENEEDISKIKEENYMIKNEINELKSMIASLSEKL